MSGRGVHYDTDYSEGGQHEKAAGVGRDERQQWDEAGWCEKWSQKEAQSGEMPSTYDSPCAETLLSTGMVRGNGSNASGGMVPSSPPRAGAGAADFFLPNSRG